MAEGMVDQVFDVINKAMAASVQRQQDTHTSTLKLIDMVFAEKMSAPDPVEAAAIRQLMHREAPIEKVKPD